MRLYTSFNTSLPSGDGEVAPPSPSSRRPALCLPSVAHLPRARCHRSGDAYTRTRALGAAAPRSRVAAGAHRRRPVSGCGDADGPHRPPAFARRRLPRSPSPVTTAYTFPTPRVDGGDAHKKSPVRPSRISPAYVSLPSACSESRHSKRCLSPHDAQNDRQ